MTDNDLRFTDLDLPPRLLLGPGPSMVHPRILRVMATPMIGYLDPRFLEVLDDVQRLLRAVFETENALTVPVPGTGSAGMQATLANFVQPGDHVLVCVSGFFGERMCEMAKRLGAEVTRIDVPWGQVVSADQVREALRSQRASLVAIVHAETSTGVLQPLDDIASVVHEHDALLLVDAVTSLGGMPVGIDRTAIDVCYSGTQKCLGCPPGLAPVTVGPRAQAVLGQRRSPVPDWYLDLALIGRYFGSEHVYHHTPSMTLMFALREALRMIVEEGLVARFERHAANARLLWDGLAELGIELHVPAAHRLPSLTTACIPPGVDEAAVRRQLLQDYNIEIGAGMGALRGKVWRIGLMGSGSRPENVVTLLGALRSILSGQPNRV